MDAAFVIRYETRAAYEWLEAILSNVTPEVAAWRPPGLANSIAATYAHLVISADVDVQRLFYGRETLLASGWGERLGLEESFPDEWPDAEINWAELRAYGREVQDRIVELTDAVTPAELDREFQMIPEHHGRWKGIDIHVLHGIHHPRLHGGEIACLKGIQGVEG